MATLRGGDGDDTITGTESSDIILGRGGNDTIRALDGDDKIDPGLGSDVVYGGDGNDRIESEAYTRGVDRNTIYGGAGNDYVRVAGNAFIDGGTGNDRIFSSGSGIELEVLGGSGNDYIDVEGWLLDVDAGDGDDFVTTANAVGTGDGGSALNGGAGIDTLYFETLTNGVIDNWADVGGFERISVRGNDSDRRLLVFSDSNFADVLDPTLYLDGAWMRYDLSAVTSTGATIYITEARRGVVGTQQDDRLFGYGILQDNGSTTFRDFAYDDVFQGGGGDDYIDGGDGVDTAIYSGQLADYTVTEVTYNLFSVTDNVGGEGQDSLVDVNKLQFSDQTVDLVIRGVEIIGDADDNVFTGGTEADHLDGRGGNDRLDGGDGNDLVEGGLGNDEVVGGEGNDFLNGDGGDDTLFGGAGDDVVRAGAGNDLIIGGDGLGDDRYIGGGGMDTVKYSSATAGISVDLASGSAKSRDALAPASIGSDVLVSIEGIIGGKHDDILSGDRNANRLHGASGGDKLSGFRGADYLDGGRGDDEVSGGSGKDVVAGGVGSDVLSGGSGADRFLFKSGWGADTITDFEATGKRHDIIDFSGVRSIRSWSDLLNNHIVEVGDDVRIDGLRRDVLILEGVRKIDLDPGDFVFS